LSTGENDGGTITGTCYPFSKKIFVTANGKILACERIGHQFALGMVTDKKVEIDIEAIADKYNNYYNKLRDKCRVCYNYNTCGQCIFHMDIDSDNPSCEAFIDQEGFKKYLSRNISHFEKEPNTYYRLMKEVIFE